MTKNKSENKEDGQSKKWTISRKANSQIQLRKRIHW